MVTLLHVDVDTSGSAAVVRPAGEVDFSTAAHLRKALGDTLSEGHHDVVVDLSEVEFMDSTGLGVLVGAMRQANAAGGTLSVRDAQARVWKTFRLTGLDRVLAPADA